MEVLSGPAAAPVWMCPECGHGSPELRDERAHLDAHRQLRVFFQEWEAGTTPEPVHGGGRPGRWRLLVVAAVGVLVLLLSVNVFSRINRASDAFRETVPATVVPAASPPAAGVTPAFPSRPVDPSPAAPAATNRPAAPLGAVPVPVPVNDEIGPAPLSSPAAPAPAAIVPPPGPSFGEYAPPRAPSHLLSACVLGICLHVL